MKNCWMNQLLLFDQRVQNTNWELVAAERTTQTNRREALVYHQRHHGCLTFLVKVGTEQFWRQVCFVRPPLASVTSGLSPRLWCSPWTPRFRVERQSEFLCISDLVSSCSDMSMTVKVVYMFKIPSGSFWGPFIHMQTASGHKTCSFKKLWWLEICLHVRPAQPTNIIQSYNRPDGGAMSVGGCLSACYRSKNHKKCIFS